MVRILKQCTFSVALMLLLSRGAAGQFVSVYDTCLVLGGEKFFFNGCNNYNLPYSSTSYIDDIFSAAGSLDLTVIRTWAFGEGVSWGFQPSAGNYNGSAWDKLDYIIQKAEQTGIKLILGLANYWSAYGGIPKYVEWTDADPQYIYTDGGWRWVYDEFYTNTQCKNLYKNFVNEMLTRTNARTGRQYRNEPAIMIWELMNEPRCPLDTTGLTLADWVDEMAGYIQGIDNNHLVAVGGEGFYYSHDTYWGYPWGGWQGKWGNKQGSYFMMNDASDNIDVAGFHLYPGGYGLPMPDTAKFWIQAHTEDAHTVLRKPVYCGEHNTHVDSGWTYRNNGFTEFYSTADNSNADGMIFWKLCMDGDHEDGYRITTSNTSTCDIISNFSATMSAKSTGSCAVDSDPPVISDALPSGTIHSTTIVLSVATDEFADVRYSTSDQAYSSMPDDFDVGQGATQHSTTLTLAAGAYTYYVRAQDYSVEGPNASASSTVISFTIDIDETPPVIVSTGPADDTLYTDDVTLTVVTDEDANVRWDVTDKAYSTMANQFVTGEGTTDHSTDLIGLANGTHTFYVRAEDLSSDGPNAMDTSAVISFVVDADILAPVVLKSLPSGTVCGPTVLLYVKTDEVSSMKWSFTDQSYNAMEYGFGDGWRTEHTTSLSVSEGQAYIIYVRAGDNSPQANRMASSEVISFAVNCGDFAELAVSPSSAVVAAGDSITLTATASDHSGVSFVSGVTWSATGGALSDIAGSTTVFIAEDAGTFEVSACSGAFTARAVIVVVDPDECFAPSFPGPERWACLHKSEGDG